MLYQLVKIDLMYLWCFNKAGLKVKGSMNLKSNGPAFKSNLKLPKTGWTTLEVVDLITPDHGCAYCSTSNIRYMHTLKHPDHAYIQVGRECAALLTGEPQTCLRLEKEARKVAHLKAARAKAEEQAKEAQERQAKYHPIVKWILQWHHSGKLCDTLQFEGANYELSRRSINPWDSHLYLKIDNDIFGPYNSTLQILFEHPLIVRLRESNER